MAEALSALMIAGTGILVCKYIEVPPHLEKLRNRISFVGTTLKVNTGEYQQLEEAIERKIGIRTQVSYHLPDVKWKWRVGLEPYNGRVALAWIQDRSGLRGSTENGKTIEPVWVQLNDLENPKEFEKKERTLAVQVADYLKRTGILDYNAVHMSQHAPNQFKEVYYGL